MLFRSGLTLAYGLLFQRRFNVLDEDGLENSLMSRQHANKMHSLVSYPAFDIVKTVEQHQVYYILMHRETHSS